MRRNKLTSERHYTLWCRSRRRGGSSFGRLFLLCLVLLALGVFEGCSARKMMVREVADSIETGLPALEQDDDLDMLEKALPANIKLLEAMLAGDPENARLSALLARLYGTYTFAFVESDLESARFTGRPDAGEIKGRVNRYYKKGAIYARRAIEARHPGCREGLDRVADADACFGEMTREDVPALFWYGFNTGGFINVNRDSIKALARGYQAEKAMQRVIALDPAYYYGGAHLFLLSYYASRSPMMGGNPDAARAHYSALKALQGDDFLLADLFYARYYLHQTQQKEEFSKTLSRITASVDSIDTYRLLNRIASNRAAVYLEAIDALFP